MFVLMSNITSCGRKLPSCGLYFSDHCPIDQIWLYLHVSWKIIVYMSLLMWIGWKKTVMSDPQSVRFPYGRCGEWLRSGALPEQEEPSESPYTTVQYSLYTIQLFIQDTHTHTHLCFISSVLILLILFSLVVVWEPLWRFRRTQRAGRWDVHFHTHPFLSHLSTYVCVCVEQQWLWVSKYSQVVLLLKMEQFCYTVSSV